MDSTSFTLRHHVTAASRARTRVSEFCRSLAEDQRSIAVLLTSELVTNALEHGEEALHVQLSLGAEGLLVEVTDDCDTHPAVENPTAHAERGRGLLIVESLSSAWGTRPSVDGRGKTVWFALRDDAAS